MRVSLMPPRRFRAPLPLRRLFYAIIDTLSLRRRPLPELTPHYFRDASAERCCLSAFIISADAFDTCHYCPLAPFDARKRATTLTMPARYASAATAAAMPRPAYADVDAEKNTGDARQRRLSNPRKDACADRSVTSAAPRLSFSAANSSHYFSLAFTRATPIAYVRQRLRRCLCEADAMPSTRVCDFAATGDEKIRHHVVCDAAVLQPPAGVQGRPPTPVFLPRRPHQRRYYFFFLFKAPRCAPRYADIEMPPPFCHAMPRT
jgi:hypothetical protein